MSCPDWSELARDRRCDDAATPNEPSAWRAAVEHLDVCDECRDDALAADPALLFRRLPTMEADAATIEEMRSGVAALRRAQRLTGTVETAAAPERGHGLHRWWGRAAAAAILAAGLLGFRPDVRDVSRMPSETRSVEAPVPLAQLEASAVSTMDEIDRPNASVYHFDEDDLGVIVVVDADLDV